MYPAQHPRRMQNNTQDTCKITPKMHPAQHPGAAQHRDQGTAPCVRVALALTRGRQSPTEAGRGCFWAARAFCIEALKGSVFPMHRQFPSTSPNLDLPRAGLAPFLCGWLGSGGIASQNHPPRLIPPIPACENSAQRDLSPAIQVWFPPAQKVIALLG